MTNHSSQDIKDTEQFDSLGDSWWDEKGPMKPLHQFTPVRLDYILDMIKRAELITSSHQTAGKPLNGLRILDVGCGGGLLAEPLARLGADVTAIDASQKAIAAAKDHARAQGLRIDYQACLAEDLAQTGIQFDFVYSSEVIEHVADTTLFLNSISQLLKENGLVVITTINRTLAALATIKIGAEYITNMIPKGTHDFDKFIKPDELTQKCKANGLLLDHFTGFAPTPMGGFQRTSFMGINYAAAGRKSTQSTSKLG